MQSALIRYIGGRSGGVTYRPPGGQPLVWSNQPREQEHPVPPNEVNYYLNRPTEFALVTDSDDPRTKQVKDKNYRFAKGPLVDNPIIARRNLNTTFEAFKSFFVSSEVSWRLSIRLKQVHSTAWLVTSQYALGEVELFSIGDDTKIEIRSHDETKHADVEALRSLSVTLRMYLDQQGHLEPSTAGGLGSSEEHKSGRKTHGEHPEAVSVSNPTAFLSYSWDNDEHKAWVRELASRLRADGVNAKIDQWETALGDQLTAFMERAIRDNDFVLIVCTPQYKWRSENRKGGVGYEGNIMTAEVYATNNDRKFIPLLRRGDWLEAAPSWLSGKRHLDLRGDPYSEDGYQELLGTIHRVLPSAPPLGPIPKHVTASRLPKGTPVDAVTSHLSEPIPPRGIYHHHAQIAEQYDKFKRQSTVTLQSGTTEKIDAQIGSWSVTYTYAGDSPSLPSEVEIAFDSPNENRSKMMSCKEVYFLINNVPVRLASHNAFRPTQDRGALWYAGVTVPLKDFLKMVNAQHLEAKVCDREIKFNDLAMEALRDIASRMQPNNSSSI